MRRFLELGDAEIGELHVEILGHEDVCRLDVAVDDAHSVRILERAAAFEDHLHHPLERQQVVHDSVLRERAAGDVVHDDVAEFLLDRSVEQGDDVRMLELSDERGLRQEGASMLAAERGILGRVAEDLERHVALGKSIASPVHRARCAPPELAEQVVLADRSRHIERHALGSPARLCGRSRRPSSRTRSPFPACPS